MLTQVLALNKSLYAMIDLFFLDVVKLWKMLMTNYTFYWIYLKLFYCVYDFVSMIFFLLNIYVTIRNQLTRCFELYC